MKIAFIILAFIYFLPAQLWAQKITIQPNHDFLRPLNYKNGKATVTFKAIYTGAMRNGDYYFFRDVLDQKRILKVNNYFTLEKIEGEGFMDTGSCLIFAPEGYDDEYAAPIAKGINWGLFKFGQVLNLTCTVYQGIVRNKKPFYVIDKVTISTKDRLEQQNFNPLIHLDLVELTMDNFAGYYTDLGSSAAETNWLLWITKNNQLVFETTDRKKHVFNLFKHYPTAKGGIDIYRNGNDWLEIKVDKLIGNQIAQKRLGTMTLNLNNQKRVVKLYGEVDEKATRH